MVVGVGDAQIADGTSAILDGAAGTLELSPDAAQLEAYALRRARPTTSTSAMRKPRRGLR